MFAIDRSESDGWVTSGYCKEKPGVESVATLSRDLLPSADTSLIERHCVEYCRLDRDFANDPQSRSANTQRASDSAPTIGQSYAEGLCSDKSPRQGLATACLTRLAMVALRYEPVSAVAASGKVERDRSPGVQQGCRS